MTGGLTLRDQGCRLVWRCHRMLWVHPADMLPTDVDCTDMDDAAFEAFVREVSP